MDDWIYCKSTLPKVSRTFALNIEVLKGELYRSILTAYLFCRIIDSIEDAAKLDPKIKIKLLLEFYDLIQDPAYRQTHLDRWVADCSVLDGNPNDLELVSQTRRVFNVFDSLPKQHRDQIIPSVSQMARGMAYFQKKFDFNRLTLLEDEHELEEYCYFVAGAVGEMLCNLFLVHLPNISEASRSIMQKNAVSFGLGLQMTNISKDVIVDRKRGWSYIPQSFITGRGLTVEEFNSEKCIEKNLQVIDTLLQKTIGHLNDALSFTLAIPRQAYTIRLFCIWPLWMAMETVAVLQNNRSLIESDDPVKISRSTVKKILRRTPLYCFSDFLLKRSFASIINGNEFNHSQKFDIDDLKNRLNQISLDNDSFKTSSV